MRFRLSKQSFAPLNWCFHVQVKSRAPAIAMKTFTFMPVSCQRISDYLWIMCEAKVSGNRNFCITFSVLISHLKLFCLPFLSLYRCSFNKCTHFNWRTERSRVVLVPPNLLTFIWFCQWPIHGFYDKNFFLSHSPNRIMVSADTWTFIYILG